MIIIVDANIVLAALIKDSTIREIIVKTELDFCFPEASVHKIRKYQSLVLEKSGLTQDEFFTLFNTLFKFIKIISNEELVQYWDDAKKIMEKIDPEDVPFVAAALSQENAVIWSDDKHFDRQKKILNLKTIDMINLFNE